MELYSIFMIVLVLCLAVLIFLILRQQSRERQEMMTTSHSFLLSMSTTLEANLSLAIQQQTLQLQEQAKLVDKAMGLVATTDPIAFQQVQAMSIPSGYDESSFDPSDQAEMERIEERNPNLGMQGDDLNGLTQDTLRELGVDPDQFWEPGYPSDPPAS